MNQSCMKHYIPKKFAKYSTSAPFFVIIEIGEFAIFSGSVPENCLPSPHFSKFLMKIFEKLCNKWLQKFKKFHGHKIISNSVILKKPNRERQIPPPLPKPN